MKRYLVLLVLVLCCTWSSEVVAVGNPDQRGSILFGYGRGFGEEVWRSGTSTMIVDSDFWRLRAVVTLPAESWVSFVLAGSVSESLDPSDESGDFSITRGVDTVDFAVRIFLP